jgi:hypothetical protein
VASKAVTARCAFAPLPLVGEGGTQREALGG